jgi:PHD/YefM family antitoxin component YafN of YafNO toxin-antitoxin module
MKVYTYSEARQRLAKLLEDARREGSVRIRRRDGQSFVVTPERRSGSPLDVEPVDLGITTEEIVEAVRESRRGRLAARLAELEPVDPEETSAEAVRAEREAIE